MRPQTIEMMVNRQVRTWQENDRREPGSDPTHPRPVVTVSREYGALGGTVAEAVAEKLNFQPFDREVVDQVAQAAQVVNTVVQSLDERRQDAITNFVAELFGLGRLANNDYLRNLSRIILTASGP